MENSRRKFLKGSIFSVAALSAGNIFGSFSSFAEPVDSTFTLPNLPYPYDALEPFIDAKTMELHHSKHHQAYVNNLNKALEGQPNQGTIEDICKKISRYPVAVRNNAGGHYNHSFFWYLMNGEGGGAPKGKLAEAINAAFGDFEKFKTKFTEAASSRFGSGWAWLVINKTGKLEIGSTPNQDNPLMDISDLKGEPILALDVWEHAYYLKYQNKRADYIQGWWNIVHWPYVQQLFEEAVRK